MSDTKNKIRVRFAPSPTGPLHMGGVRTALYNYLFAKQLGGDFILRIEDTDTARFVPGAEDYIVQSLKWCGIEPTEGVGFNDGPHAPYRQSERQAQGIYRPFVDKLIADGLAYYAFDTKDDLEAMRTRLKEAGMKTTSYDVRTRETMNNSLKMSADEIKAKLESGTPYVVRIKMPINKEIKFDDLIKGPMKILSHQVDDKVLYKSDGPTYHLANVVDDHLMEITHVIRGDDWLPSCPLHIILYDYFGWDRPQFAHLPLVVGPSGKKLSKRDGDTLGFPVYPLRWKDPTTGETSSGYKERGYLPEAFVNMLALIGWNPGGNVEIMSMDEMISLFSLDRVNKSSAKFDLKKAEFLNRTYMKKANDERLATIWSDILHRDRPSGVEKLTLGDNRMIGIAVKSLKEKNMYIDQFWNNGKYFFIDPPGYSADARYFSFNKAMMNKLQNDQTITHDEAKAIFEAVIVSENLDARDAGKFLRLAITGMEVGPPMFDIMSAIGPDACHRRLGNTQFS